MNNFDDILSSQPKTISKPESKQYSEYSKEEYAAYKQQEREQVYSMIDNTVVEVAASGDKFKQFLDTQSHFDRYSVANNLLIMAQMPEATKVKDYDAWKDAGVYVQKNPKAILILEPGELYTAEDGSSKTSFNVKRVYDVSQTGLKDKEPPFVKKDDRLLLKALLNNSPVPINISENIPANMGAIFDPAKSEIRIRPGMDAPDIYKALSLELAHVELNTDAHADRKEKAAKAYCVSYILCKRGGYDVGSFDFTRMPESFMNMETKDVRSELSSIREASNEISSRMSQVLEPPKQNRNNQEQER
jgi:hypothetical protein